MERLRAKNVFEANKICYLFSRILNFEYVTIERSKNDGMVKGNTTKWDVLRLIVGFSCGILIFYDVASTKLKPEKRSIIFEMAMSFNGKIQALQPSLVMLQVFHYRYEYFKIFMILDWIDRKVINGSLVLN